MDTIVDTTPLFQENKTFSAEKNNIIRDANRIYYIISSAGRFRTNYSDLAPIIDGINNRCKQYTKTSVRAIKCDVVDGVIASLSFDDLGQKLKQKLAKKEMPVVGLQYTSLLESNDISDVELNEYQTDEIDVMQSVLPPASAKITREMKKEIKQFIQQQTSAIEYLKSFVSDFDDFETRMVNYRQDAIKIMNNNIPFLENLHYKHVYDFVVKKIELPQSVTVDGISIPFNKSQKEFLKTAINKLVLG